MTDNTDPLFSSSDDQSPPLPEDHDYVADLVGEGKKFKDANTLARSVLHKDLHIKEIEKENADLRQTVKQGLSREEFYEAIKNLKEPSQSTQTPKEGETERTELSVEQLSSLVDKRFEERSEAKKQEDNLVFAVSEAKKRLGDGFQKLLKDRAKELGESEQDLTRLARTRPKLFLELMAPEQRKETDIPGVPRTQVDTSKQSGGSGIRDAAYYRNLKKTNPDLYKSRDIERQMHQDALALGEKFFN